MSKKAYSQKERKQIYYDLLAAGRKLFARQGYRQTNLSDILAQVGISKNFFYTYFSSKEEFVARVLASQQPLLVELARDIMAKPGITWQEAVRQFLSLCADGANNGIFIMTLAEQEAVFRTLKLEDFTQFHNAQEDFYRALLYVWGFSNINRDLVKIFANMALSSLIVHKSMAESIRPLFADKADETLRWQIDSLIWQMEKFYK